MCGLMTYGHGFKRWVESPLGIAKRLDPVHASWPTSELVKSKTFRCRVQFYEWTGKKEKLYPG
jgi:hypothetical protein